MAPPKNQMSGPLHLRTDSPGQTIDLAEAAGRLCRAGDVICLQGALGAGKTHFVKGLAKGLNIKSSEKVTSPTYVLLQKYDGRLTLFHFDAYRLDQSEEMMEIGCEEIFDSGGVSVIEWADRVTACLPPDHFLITIRIKGEQQRDILFGAVGDHLSARIEEMERELTPWKVPG